MDSILQQITDWLKEMLVEAIMGNLSGLFDSVNNQVGEIASDVGMTPANFSPGVFAMIRNISENVIIPTLFETRQSLCERLRIWLGTSYNNKGGEIFCEGR